MSHRVIASPLGHLTLGFELSYGMKLHTTQSMRAADATAPSRGISLEQLMENAGQAVAEVYLKEMGNLSPVILCGSGNNGGDGFVAAKILQQNGLNPKVYVTGISSGLAYDKRLEIEALSVPILSLWEYTPRNDEGIIEGLFGSGLNRPLGKEFARLFRQIESENIPVLAIDIPAGMPFDTFLRAKYTVALAAYKQPHMFEPFKSSCGIITLAPIGMPRDLLESPELPEIFQASDARALLPKRSPDAHKNSVGRILVIGGSEVYAGAPSLTALAAYRSGAGLVHVASQVEPRGLLPEAIFHRVAGWDSEKFSAFRVDSMAIGMGGGASGRAMALAGLEMNVPTVLDADALHPDIIDSYLENQIPLVLTPHLGEAARLLECEIGALNKDPLETARKLAKRFDGATIVLKGAPSVIAIRNRLSVNTTGNSAMATAGMGDVMSGAISALLSNGLTPWDAALLGVFLHGLAGDNIGKIGLTATDVANEIKSARGALLEI